MALQPDPTHRPATSAYRELQAGQKAETRRRILEAARPVFLREGFHTANLNEVARDAGVGKGTLYRHFENKGELYLAVLTENGDAFLEDMRGAVDPEADALKQVEQIARFYVDFWSSHPEYFRILWAVQNTDLIGPLSPELETKVRLVFERPIRLLEALIRGGVERGELRACDPWNTANAIAVCGSTSIGYITGTVTHPVKRDHRAVFEQLLDVFLAGLTPVP